MMTFVLYDNAGQIVYRSDSVTKVKNWAVRKGFLKIVNGHVVGSDYHISVL